MDKIIKVDIYGIGEAILGSCCNKNNESKSNCSGGGCNNSCQSSKKCNQAYEDLNSFLKNSEVKENVSLNYIEMDSKGLAEYEEIEELIKRGFELPVTVIDGIVRYYGGISANLVYKDVKELLEYYGENK